MWAARINWLLRNTTSVHAIVYAETRIKRTSPMLDLTTRLRQLNQPNLLVRAARFGIEILP
jgi:hypothetical protein